MTEFVFENGVREGQYLSTTFAHNLSPQFNYSVRYRGLRSVGFYQNNLAANNAFIATINHQSKNERFKLWSHFASQAIDNDENAGIRDLNEFVHDDSLRTTNRQNIAINLNSAYTEFDSRRFHIGAQYVLLRMNNDSTSTVKSPLTFKNIFSYDKHIYFFREHIKQNMLYSDVMFVIFRSMITTYENLQ